ncbi:MAG: hypothetical protein P8R42_20935 [Candidatus Binatia bacterium]|nr:hypothetical protein [Candidatus Binatia bacterium]
MLRVRPRKLDVRAAGPLLQRNESVPTNKHDALAVERSRAKFTPGRICTTFTVRVSVLVLPAESVTFNIIW